ncbi:MAG: DNA double-strand break repair nuclease NurA [Candidatus Heimdallarchaeota archaeon]
MEFDELDTKCARIADAIRSTIDNRNKLCGILKKIRFKEIFRNLSSSLRNGIRDDTLSVLVKPTDLTGLHIAGIDGGLVSSRLQYFDVLLTRAVVVVFRYGKLGKITVEHLMSHESTPEITVKTEALSRKEFEVLSSIRRTITEIELAQKAIEQQSLNVILLDGSIMPQKADHPVASSSILEEYNQMLNCYQQFYETCEDRGVLAIGCIKDSKSTHFREIIARALPTIIQHWRNELEELLSVDYRHILTEMFDSEYFYRLLDPRERSCCYTLEERNTSREEGLGTDLSIYCFYLKTVPLDFPLRIEFLSGREKPDLRANRIASVIYPLSSHHSEYGLPSVLIEADARARLHQVDLDLVIEGIIHKIGTIQDPWRLRRERSPF